MSATEYEAVPAVDADCRSAAARHAATRHAKALHDRDEVRRHVGRRPGEAEARRGAARRRARGRAPRRRRPLGDGAHDRRAARPRPPGLAARRTRASSTCCVSVGERISCALAAMVIHDLGHEAISLTGSQAGIVTDTVHGKAKIVEVRARRIHEALDEGTIVLVAGFQGVSTALRGDDARPRRLRHDRRRAGRSARRGLLRDLHRRPRRLLGRPAARPERAPADARQLRRDARDGVLGRGRAGHPLDRGRAQSQCAAPRPLVLRRRGRDVDPGGGRRRCSRRH